MIVKCINTTGALLPSASLFDGYGITADTSWDISPEKEYCVFAITNLRGFNYYYILEDGRQDAPSLVPSLLFETVDNSIPEGWSYEQESQGDQVEDFYFMIASKEWIDDPMFLEKLFDNEPVECEMFKAQIEACERNMAKRKGNCP